jgi:uncharacterized damage-inducible protein DinB
MPNQPPATRLHMPEAYLDTVVREFQRMKALADGAISQLSPERFFASPGASDNSVAVIVKHVGGNLVSRWTDFLTTDGEKPWRARDSEFTAAPATRQELLALWNAGWERVFSALEPLSDQDLGRTVTIRGEAHSVMQAINRQIAHYSYHCGQIVFLAKHLRSEQWQSLSVPRGKSAEFNTRVTSGNASQR